MATSCPADRILVTSALFTGVDDEPAPGAVAIGGDRVLWAGPLEVLPDICAAPIPKSSTTETPS